MKYIYSISTGRYNYLFNLFDKIFAENNIKALKVDTRHPKHEN